MRCKHLYVFTAAMGIALCGMCIQTAGAADWSARLDDLMAKAQQCVPLSERENWSALSTLYGCQKLLERYESTGDRKAYDAAVATGWDIACEPGYIANRESNEAWLRLCQKLRSVTDDLRWDEQQSKARCRSFGSSGRLDRSKFIVGSYGLSGITNLAERNVQDLAECGIDIISIGGNDVSPEGNQIRRRQILDWFSKYGVKCILGWQLPGDWGWNGGDLKKHYKKGERWAKCDMNRFDAYTARFKDHPAIAMISTCDEPSALDYSFRAKTTRRVMRNFPNQIPFFNLFPNYALPDNAKAERAIEQLGTKDYERYVAEYVEKIPLDYISYDFYPWAWNVTFRNYYDNLRVVADACTATGKSHWLYLQCTRYNQDKKERYPILDEPRLRYQASAALAYGAECIIWACWAPSWGGWDINAVDAAGRPTAVYEPLKKVNSALHALSPDYMKYRRYATDLVGLDGELAESSSAAFRHVKAEDGAALAVGHFNSRTGNGNYAMFVAAIDDPNGNRIVKHDIAFEFALKGFKLRAVSGDGPVEVSAPADGKLSVPLETCHGIFLIAERQ